MTTNVCTKPLWLKWGHIIILFSCFRRSFQTSPAATAVTWICSPAVSNYSPSSCLGPPHQRLHPHQLHFLCFWLILSHLRVWNYQWELFRPLRYEMAEGRLQKTLINLKWRGAHSKSRWIPAIIEIWFVMVAVFNPSWGWKLILCSVCGIIEDIKEEQLVMGLKVCTLLL